MKPFFQLPTYFGGKAASGVPHQIINQIPAHQTFISGFLGHCAIMRYKRPAERSIGVEINPEIIENWKTAQLAPLKLAILPGDFITLEIEELTQPKTFLYLDPPYPLASRRSAHRYPHELTDDQHEALLSKISSLKIPVAISTYDNPIYSSALADWRKISFPSQTRGKTPATETLYMNYDEPAPLDLHDTRFLGTDYRQREKSKRRIETIARKIERLEPHEIALLLERVKTDFPELF